VTTIDQRYSDPEAVAAGWTETRAVLEQAELAWLSTVQPDGRPHVTPVAPVWFEDAAYFHTGPAEQKAANLRANPHVILTTGCNRWDAGLDVVIEGDAVRVTDEDLLKRLAEVWATKWDRRWQLEVRDGGFRHAGFASHAFEITPTRIHAHSKGDPFAHTRHTF